MTEKSVLKELGVDKPGVFENGIYTVELNDSNEWGKVFSLLEKSDEAKEVEGDTLTVDGGEFLYEYTADTDFGEETFYITLSSSFEDDVYKIEVEKEEED